MMTSAGDHERLPKTDKDGDSPVDLKGKVQAAKKQKIPDKYLKQLRKGIKHTKKWSTFGEVGSSEPQMMEHSDKISKLSKNQDMKSMLDLARQSKSGFTMKHNKRTPVKKKR